MRAPAELEASWPLTRVPTSFLSGEHVMLTLLQSKNMNLIRFRYAKE